MQRILSPVQMRVMEQRAMRAGSTGIDLMEKAAFHIAEKARELAGESLVLFLCGVGNNGGDGMAAARLLQEMGGDVIVALVGDRERLTNEARMNWERLVKVKIPVVERYELLCPTLIVDALVGIGLTHAPLSHIKNAISWTNASGCPVLAVDLPSGVDARDGSTPGVAVRAQSTVTFHARKLGHVLFPGRALCGEVFVRDIGLADELGKHDADLIETADIPHLLPPRVADTHKGMFGRLLIVAGSLGMAGAAVLCARGALHAGAGLTTVATIPDSLPIVQTLAPEATAFSLPSDVDECGVAIADLLSARDVVAIGPGMTMARTTHAALKAVLHSGKPCVIDADGLNVLAEDLAELKAAGIPPVLTPHPGEMTRLQQRPVGNPLDDARAFSTQYGVILLLKGATTIIASPDGRETVNLTGTPAMSRGGSGDVLTGVIGALLAQGLSPYDAARLGAYLHGRAGEAAYRVHGLAMTAMDLPRYLFSD